LAQSGLFTRFYRVSGFFRSFFPLIFGLFGGFGLPCFDAGWKKRVFDQNLPILALFGAFFQL